MCKAFQMSASTLNLPFNQCEWPVPSCLPTQGGVYWTVRDVSYYSGRLRLPFDQEDGVLRQSAQHASEPIAQLLLRNPSHSSVRAARREHRDLAWQRK
jgi:hypothetical protein